MFKLQSTQAKGSILSLKHQKSKTRGPVASQKGLMFPKTNQMIYYYLQYANIEFHINFYVKIDHSLFIYSFPLKCKETITKMIYLAAKFNIVADFCSNLFLLNHIQYNLEL